MGGPLGAKNKTLNEVECQHTHQKLSYKFAYILVKIQQKHIILLYFLL